MTIAEGIHFAQAVDRLIVDTTDLQMFAKDILYNGQNESVIDLHSRIYLILIVCPYRCTWVIPMWIDVWLHC